MKPLLKLAAPYLPTSTAELLERHQDVLELFRSGELSKEVEAIGVRPQWLEHYHAQTPFVAIAEQQMPLSSIFHHLGNYGSPAALCRAGSLLKFLRGKLELLHGREAHVGLLVSPDDQVTFGGVTNGFFLPMPPIGHLMERAAGEPSSDYRMENLQLLSKSQRDKLESNRHGGVAYRSVAIDMGKVREILKWVDKAIGTITPSLTKNQRALAKQDLFYDEHASTFPETELEKLQGQRAATVQRIATCEELVQALRNFGEDVNAALTTCITEPSQSKISYWDFIDRLNTIFTDRLSLNFAIKTLPNNLVNEFPSVGVANWSAFLRAFVDSDVIRPDECALRWRVDTDGQLSRYISLAIQDIQEDDVILRDKAGNTYSARELQAVSLASIQADTGPRLIPGASIIYWVNYAIGNSIVLDDGMNYPKIARLASALESGTLSSTPRKLVIYPYTKLWSYDPPNPEDPYEEIKPSSSTLDYYRFLLRKGCCE